MATAPQPRNPGSASGPAAFAGLIEAALTARGARASEPRVAYGQAVAAGEPAPALLCRYAAGAVAPSERQDVAAFLGRSPWAARRVAALVTGARPDSGRPLARALLEAGRAETIDPYRVAAGVLLELGGRPVTADGDDDSGDDPLAEAARELKARRLERAADALRRSGVELGELADPLQQVLATSDEDEALYLLLDAA